MSSMRSPLLNGSSPSPQPWSEKSNWDISDYIMSLPIVLICIAIVALLYSAVGHAGASGYIAVFTLLSFAPENIRPTALLLNLFVSVVATFQFSLAGHFRWKLFWPFALFAVPCAYLGAMIPLSTSLVQWVLGLVLLFSAIRFLITLPRPESPNNLRLVTAVPTGAALGFLAGLSGTGGGIFLSPLLLLANWATVKQAAAVSAPFILVNSAAGLIGFGGGNFLLSESLHWLIGTVLVAGLIGSGLAAWKLPVPAIRAILSGALLVASAKFLLPI